ncbi:MAG TPA: hypothetical protein VFZ32_22015 [Micromonosporaceae bacterium]
MLTEQLAAHVARYRAETQLSNDSGGQLGPWALERAVRSVRVRGGRFGRRVPDTYAHLRPDADVATRAALEAALVAGADKLRTGEGVN